MTDIGHFSLLMALMVSAYAGVISFWGTKIKNEQLIKSSKNAVLTLVGLLTIASLSLIYALLTRDFQVEYVASYTSSTLPLFYTLSAFWAGQKGSLLFWVWLLVIFASIIIIQNRDKNHKLISYVTAVLMSITLFFLVLMVFVTDPFERLSYVPQEGKGLNPLLQNPGMIFHPPLFI